MNCINRFGASLVTMAVSGMFGSFAVLPCLADSEAALQAGSEAQTQSSSQAKTNSASEAMTHSSSQAAHESSTQARHEAPGPVNVRNTTRTYRTVRSTRRPATAYWTRARTTVIRHHR